jgi:hypothetical protein
MDATEDLIWARVPQQRRGEDCGRDVERFRMQRQIVGVSVFIMTIGVAVDGCGRNRDFWWIVEERKTGERP